MVELEDAKKIPVGCFITDDTTIEGLSNLMANNPRCFMLILDEFSMLLQSFSRKGREQDRAFWLQAFNGNAPYVIHRKSTGETKLDLLSAVLIGGIQPEALNEHTSGPLDGFFQRFLLFVWPDKPPRYVYVIEDEIEALTNKVKKIFDYFENLEPKTYNLKSYSDVKKIDGLHFDSKAQPVFRKWLEDLYNRIAEEFGSKPAFKAHLGKYPKLCTSLSLIFHLIKESQRNQDSEPRCEISLESLELAIKWCDFLEQHARKLYSQEINAELVSAIALLEKIEEGKVKDKDTIKSIYDHHWQDLGTKQEVKTALTVLEQYNHARTKKEKSSKGKGRPSEVIRIHPNYRDFI